MSTHTPSVLQKLVQNGHDLRLDQWDQYAAILGEFPSRGAKSPTLWNAAFEKLGISSRMFPLDVAPDNLKQVFSELRRDARFIGAAVTMPYKQSIVSLLDDLEPEAKVIGAVNCIYRRGKALIGSNTDGAGALQSLTDMVGDEGLIGKTIVIFGMGGAGLAVLAYMAQAVGANGRLIVMNRNLERAQSVAARLRSRCKIEVHSWPPHAKDLARNAIFVNCTSIGFKDARDDQKGIDNLMPYTPLASLDTSVEDHQKKSKRILEEAQPSLVFDIIYQPFETTLLRLAKDCGIPRLNGVGMNLEQAVIAFDKVLKGMGNANIESSIIRRYMGTAY